LKWNIPKKRSNVGAASWAASRFRQKIKWARDAVIRRAYASMAATDLMLRDDK
jgi:hypothetical protein